MTKDDVKRIAEAIADADGGCIVCVSGIAANLAEAFPEHDWAEVVSKVPNQVYGPVELRKRIKDELVYRASH